MKYIVVFSFILACGCAPTVSHETVSGDTQFRITDANLERNDGSGSTWVSLGPATAVSADQGVVYMIRSGVLYQSPDLGNTWENIFSASDPVTDVEAVGGYLWISVASWGTSSGIHRRSPDGTWQNLLWNSCYAVDVNPRHPDRRARALVKEGGYDRYWVYAPLFPPYLWAKLWPAPRPS